MRSTMVVPWATSPATTRLAEARRSVAHDGGAVEARHALTTAVLPSMRMFGAEPRQFHGVHVAILEDRFPDHRRALGHALMAMNCACMSVGKAG